MTRENYEWCKNTDVTDEMLICGCGREKEIYHCSHHHDGTGIFYTKCTCGMAVNVPWKKVERPLSPAQKHLAKLPASCYAVLLTNGEMIQIRAGEKGYYRLGQAWLKQECKDRNITMDELADFLNKGDGVTKGQREAMEAGSMFGWEVPGADSDLYTEDGIIIKAKLHGYGE